MGGLERVFEIGKQFRNESIDTTHLPEFTTIEAYCAFEDISYLLDMTEELLSLVFTTIKKGYLIEYDGQKIDFTPPYARIDLSVEVPKQIKKTIADFEMPDDLYSDEANTYLSNACYILKVDCTKPRTTARLLDKLIGHYVEPQCINPTFLINHWQVMSPLAKPHRSKPGLAERAELFINGTELCNMYTELNDPAIQRKCFEAQLADQTAGDTETPIPDMDYLEALYHALPPTAGLGMGIDRLMMLLTGHTTIRANVMYPTMKPIKTLSAGRV